MVKKMQINSVKIGLTGVGMRSLHGRFSHLSIAASQHAANIGGRDTYIYSPKVERQNGLRINRITCPKEINLGFRIQ
ncbi:hypothetical protein AB9F29_21505, partial [Falsihalocynthiibacter sp. S25ZX9]|uniref:hypothetical protein n=1 Tax=Falsihalocynthiibacter sp. S25ZX9 TaxID=3240870 RepID=UPI00350FD5A0